jgi:hypothetical protein
MKLFGFLATVGVAAFISVIDLCIGLDLILVGFKADVSGFAKTGIVFGIFVWTPAYIFFLLRRASKLLEDKNENL